jgi:hypothetical protein
MSKRSGIRKISHPNHIFDEMKQIIDFERKGNVIRFFLGENGKQWGDDWDDAPYEHNAGTVYNEFVSDIKDVMVPFDWEVSEPSGDFLNSPYSKQDFMRRNVACLTLKKPDGSEINILYGDEVPLTD